MYWQEDTTEQEFQVPDDFVDILFDIDCKQLPVDHASALSLALERAIPWLGQNERVAVHTVHVAGSQNGWERPEHGTDQPLILSRRTKLTIRAPKDLLSSIRDHLTGETLEVAGHPLTVGNAKIKPLSKQTTLFARYVVGPEGATEERFLRWAAAELESMGIKIRKALCGKNTPLTTPEGPIHTRSLLLADLTPEQSVRLQQIGLGTHRKMGCGIFIPHKGIDAVKKSAGD
jgi:CRISPR-associated protein Cas6